MIELLFNTSYFLELKVLLSFFTTLVLMLLFGNKIISFLRTKQGKGQPIREDGPQSHLLTKKGTPTMGGLIIVGSILISFLVWGGFNVFSLTAIAVLIIYAAVGFIDDYEKVTKQTSNAMTPRMKLLLQFSVSLACVLIITWATDKNMQFDVRIPFFRNLAINLSWFYIPFAMIVIAGSSNAVNLTDGLDGLASGLLAIIFSFFVFICMKNQYTIYGIGNVALVCASVVGACIGFLWFNASPAKVFMGDTGSLALGALLGTVSVMTKSELLLAIVGFIFVAEALSVMIQVFWFKKTGKRVFKMAPLHHHFEQLGMAETTIVMRFWIIGLMLFFLGCFASVGM